MRCQLIITKKIRSEYKWKHMSFVIEKIGRCNCGLKMMKTEGMGLRYRREMFVQRRREMRKGTRVGSRRKARSSISIHSSVILQRQYVLPVTVYIEDTDAFGVCYHSNYLKYCARARSAIYADINNYNGTDTSSLRFERDVHERCFFIPKVKFLRAAVLGSSLRVQTFVYFDNRYSTNDDKNNNNDDINSMKFVHKIYEDHNSSNDEYYSNYNVNGVTPVPALFEAEIEISFMNHVGNLLSFSSSLSMDSLQASADCSFVITKGSDCRNTNSDAYLVTEVEIFPDECCHRFAYHNINSADDTSCWYYIPNEVDILRWFERNRTELIGGAASLREIQEEDNILIVVASISDLNIMNNHKNIPENLSLSLHLHQKIQISSISVSMRLRNTCVRFVQTAKFTSEDSEDHIIAVGTVTCMCVDKQSMKVCAAPEHVINKLIQNNSVTNDINKTNSPQSSQKLSPQLQPCKCKS